MKNTLFRSLFLVLSLGLFTALPSPASAAAAPTPPSAQSAARPTRARPPAAAGVVGMVNLNTATPQELQLLPGIGPAKARDIVALRASQPFKTVDDLLKVKGIGRKMLVKLRPHLGITGPTTVRRATTATAAMAGR
jgi:competence protein ComEA